VVLQANLGVGSARPADVVARVRADHVDVLATEELTVAEQRRLVRAGLARLLPYRFTRPLPTGGGGIGVWSRYPLVGARDRGGFWLGVITARVRLPVATVSLVAVHLTPPYPYPSTRWRHEIARLRTLLPRSGAAVVAGDFNATVDHTRYRALLRRGYRDAAVEAGAGYLPTYPTDRWYGPVIGIDHVLVRGRVRARDVLTLDQPGSDHRALLARLVY
jgi:endonuclease/exonuclease/phosphatase (EEP) superfamily protein YafD